MKKYIVLLSALMLPGCLIVEDYGSYWDKAFSDSCINAIAREHYLNDKDKSKELSALSSMVRSLKSGGYTFLLLKDEETAKGGTLSRYEVKGGQYIAYGIKDGMDAQFAKEYPDSPIKLEGGDMAGKLAKVHTLTPEVMTVVESVASKPDYWVETNRTEYNPSKNPECKQ